jgi:tyrosine-specific transport protein
MRGFIVGFKGHGAFFSGAILKIKHNLLKGKKSNLGQNIGYFIMSNSKKIFNASLLISGTTIGAGMLALPVVTASSGFLPSVILFFICYLFMMATGLLLVEALMWYEGEFNLITLSSKLLGKWGKWAAWALYLFLFYTLTVAYTAGGGDIIQNIFNLPKFLAQSLFVLFFAYFVMKGTSSVNRINNYLMLGMIVAYLALILTGFSNLNFDFIKTKNFSHLWLGLPVVFTSFSYQGILPSIKTYLNADYRAIRTSLFIGITIPFIFYVVWQGFIMGLISPSYLLEAGLAGKSAIFPLEKQLDSPWIFTFGKLFAFFAITTSFLGVTLGLKDFLKDGLRMPKKHKGLFLFILTFGPPFLITQFSYDLFILALRFAGGIGCALLLGLMPIMMVWRGRYVLGHRGVLNSLLDNKLLLSTLGLFVVIEVLMELNFLFFN